MTAVAFGHFGPLAYQKIAVGAVAVGISQGSSGALRPQNAVIVVKAQPIRWTEKSGDTPTATNGNYAPADSVITLTNRASIKNFLAIRDTAATADAELEVQPYHG